jgi:hypothetical protein
MILLNYVDCEHKVLMPRTNITAHVKRMLNTLIRVASIRSGDWMPKPKPPAPIQKETAAIASDPDVLASSLLALGPPIWKFISTVSNIDFLLSINEQKFAVLFDFMENTGWILIMLFGAGWLGVKYARGDWRTKQQGSPSWGLVIAVGLMTFMFGVLLAVKSTGAVPNVIGQWSLQNGQCSVVVDTAKLGSFRKDYKLAVVCGVLDPKKDRMEDENISVSAPFTIVAGGVPILVPTRPAMAPLLQQGAAQVWFDPIIVPNDVSVDKITRLSDVRKLGGKILRPEYFN